MTDILVVETWPDGPGYPAQTITRRAKRRAMSADGRWWLVRERGIFRRWQWRPVVGTFVRLYEQEPRGDGTASSS